MGLLEGRVRHCVIRIVQFKEHNDHALRFKGQRLPFNFENEPLQICAPSNGEGDILCPGTRIAHMAPDTFRDTLSTTIVFSLHTGTVPLWNLKPQSSFGPGVLSFRSTENQVGIPSTIWAPARSGEAPMLKDAIPEQRNAAVAPCISNRGQSIRILDQHSLGTSNCLEVLMTRK